VKSFEEKRAKSASLPCSADNARFKQEGGEKAQQ